MTRGEAMRRARENAGYTREALAARAGIAKSTVTFLEKDKYAGQLVTIELLADALCISLDEYVGRTVPKKAAQL